MASTLSGLQMGVLLAVARISPVAGYDFLFLRTITLLLRMIHLSARIQCEQVNSMNAFSELFIFYPQLFMLGFFLSLHT